jgi:thiamine-phosphate pyrophosphorylase
MLRYAITDPLYHTSDPDRLKERVAETLRRHRVDLICLRDKRSDDYRSLAEAFLSLKPSFPSVKFLLHTHLAPAATLGADGIHLPSGAMDRIASAKSAGLWTIVSTHTPEEALRCERAGADAVTFSPVFDTPGKGPAQGLEKLKEIKDKISIKLFALGGIVTEREIEAVERAGADGFASIRYFVP